MASATKICEQADRAVTAISLGISGLALFSALIVGTIQVLSRFLLHIPTTWSESALRVALIWCVFLAMPSAVRVGALLSVDFLDRSLSGTRYHIWLRIFIAFCVATVLMVLLIAGYSIASRLSFQTIPGLGISISVAYAAIPIGAVLSLVSLAAALWRPIAPALETQTL